MAMALVISNECIATLIFDGLSLDFVLDVDSSVQATRARFGHASLPNEFYFEGYINVRQGEADPVTSLLISGQDAGEINILLSRFAALICATEERDFQGVIDGKSLSRDIRDKSLLAYSTDGKEYSFERLSKLTAQVVSESSFGRLSYYKLGEKFFLEAEIFSNERIFSSEVDARDLRQALEDLQREFSDQLAARLLDPS
jgi:hypothetical protein